MKFVVPGSLSLERTSWDNIDYYIPNYFTKDFCHDSILTLKLRALSREATIVKLQRRYSQKTFEDRIKLWITLNRIKGHLYFIYEKNKFKIHYEHDLIHPYNTELCLYGSIDFLRNGKDPSLRLGCDYFGGLYRINNRLKITPKYVEIF